jgi:hypothetical protein
MFELLVAVDGIFKEGKQIFFAAQMTRIDTIVRKTLQIERNFLQQRMRRYE